MRILFDAQGGDNAPLSVIKGAIEARDEFGVEVALIGNEKEIRKAAEENDLNLDFEIINVQEVIENSDNPATAIRRKKDSSIVRGLGMLKENTYDCFVSCGSTGALLAGGLFIVGRIPNIKRAVLPTFIPNIKGKTLLIDSGANMDCDENLLFEFAETGKVYLESLGIENPKIGLLNVGVEEGKGNSVTKKTFSLLKDSNLNFIGNVEARDISMGICDLVICDGFVGNTILKTTEGVAGFLVKTLKKTLLETDITDEQRAMILKNFSKSLDYKDVGGVLLLGLNKILIKAHGSSDARAIKNAAKSGVFAQENNIIEKLRDTFMEEEK
ncbi:phosphate acyltransferase PlsX [Peptoniphilus catoniae]|uniref:phosphate acyltransferase PlsX n=1 Tax=Peptoniphilus catoniae TaxID=1660341 RepID=UPI0010FE71A8|nr:phosphate acyltransferase PlsX [Peptoniphilus catoniae]